MRLVISLFIAMCCWAGPVHAHTVILNGGSQVTAPLIKETVDTLFLDLGYDVLAIPKKMVAEIISIPIRDNQPALEDLPGTTGQTRGLVYNARTGNRLSTSEGVRLNGPCVVVVRSPGGTGSGFIVNNRGYLITNFHVIKKQKHISVTRFIKTGPELKRIIYNDVRIVALDSFHDLAVLQIEGNDDEIFPEINLSPDDEPVFGEKVFVIGNPLGLERTVTEGVLSHVGRLFGGNLYLQIDASVNPGNSGGPLFNGKGQVIGVVNMGIASMQGLNFAIPIRHVKFLLDNVASYAYDQSNSESGFIYLSAPENLKKIKSNRGNQ